MYRMNKKTKQELLDIFGQPDIKIQLEDYNDYCRKKLRYYKVINTQFKSLLDISVTPIICGVERYEIIWPNGKKISRLVRTNAVLRRPTAADIMEVYNWLKLRLLLQNTNQTQIKK